MHIDDCEDHMDHAALYLVKQHDFTEMDAQDAATETVRAAARVKIDEYREQISGGRLNATEIALTTVRIDTLEKFAYL